MIKCQLNLYAAGDVDQNLHWEEIHREKRFQRRLLWNLLRIVD
jgi:hypothetical protein